MIRTRQVEIEETCVARNNRLWKAYMKAVEEYRTFPSLETTTAAANALRAFINKEPKVVEETRHFWRNRNQND